MGDRKDIQLDSTTTGVHKTGKIRDVVTEWNPKEPAAQEFRDMVLRELTALKNNVPDFDSGYFYVEVDSSYKVAHEALGGVPNRVVVYHSSVAEPENDSNVRVIPSISFIDSANASDPAMVLSGIQVNHVGDGKSTLINTARDSLLQHSSSQTTGYIRLLLWR